MQTLSQIKSLLTERNLRPRHRFGQNFLHDQNKLRQILQAAQIQPNDLVLEVGPGTGTLTHAILDQNARLIAVEIDCDLTQLLSETVTSPLFTLLNEDALASKHALNPTLIQTLQTQTQNFTTPFKLIANLPYNIASPLLATLATDFSHAMELAIIMVQKEVADRFIADHNSKDYGPITILLQSLYHITRITNLSPSCFWPQPKIASSVVQLTRLPAPLTTKPKQLAAFLQTLFTKRRKQLASILPKSFPFPTDIDPKARPEQLSVQQLITLADIADQPPKD